MKDGFYQNMKDKTDQKLNFWISWLGLGENGGNYGHNKVLFIDRIIIANLMKITSIFEICFTYFFGYQSYVVEHRAKFFIGLTKRNS